MKQYIILSIFVLFTGTALRAQSVRTDYFLQNSYSRTALNPAFIPRQGYIGVPGLADIAVGASTNALYLDNLVFNKNGEKVTFMHPWVGSSEFLSNLPDKSNLSANLNYHPVSFGFFDKKGGFWSFGIGVRTLADINIPKPLFELLKVGFTSDDRTINYPVQNLSLSATAYSEVSVGHARTLLDSRLSVGAKAKLLLGAVDMDLNVESLDVTVQKDQWIARSKATLKGSGIKAGYSETGVFETIELESIGATNFGLGVDLGAVYAISDRARVSLAFTDLGFISWSAGKSVNLKAPETQVVVKPGEYSSAESNFNFKENLNTAIDDIREAINFKESGQAQGRFTTLTTTVNAGLEYEVLPGSLSAGLLSSTYLGSNIASELTLSANYNPASIKWLSAALSYSFIHTRFNTFGLALHIAPSKVLHFFIASDYFIPKVSPEFLPVSSKAVNIQFGLAVPIGKVRN
ncbi:MAG: DUF5723 family protein [Tannerellaceae bacterium]|jgi:hypothetical protein|nr:DUF5723 family protein [Tannerellaceae bacterium]